MNLKVYSVLLCAFLASMLFQGKLVLGEPDQSEKECSDSVKVKQQIRANSTTMRYGIFNERCNAGLIIDVEDEIAILVKGNEGTAVLIDVKSNKTRYISSGISDPESLLDSGLDLDDDESGSVENCNESYSEEVIDLAKSIFDCLFRVDEAKIDIEEGLELIIEISKNMIELLKADLKGLIELSEEKVNVKQDVPGIYNVLKGLSAIFGHIPGGLEGLIEKDVPLDLHELADSENGIDSLAIIFHQIGSEVDIGKTLGSVLNDPAKLFIVISELGAEETTGINGLLSILGTAACYLEGKGNFEVVLNFIIQVLVNPTKHCNEDLGDSLNQSLKNLLDIVAKLGVSDSLSGLVSTIESLLDGKLELGGINISCALEYLVNGLSNNGSTPLITLVESKACDEAEKEGIVSTLLVLIVDITNPLYLNLVEKVGIDINQQECSSNYSKAISTDSNADLYNILISLPGIKDVTESLETVVKEATDGRFDLKELINNNDLNELIKAVLQIEGYVNFNLSEDTLDEVQELISEIISLRAYFGLDICSEKFD